MSPAPFTLSANQVDLSPRIVASSTVVASPTDATETIIASVTVPGGLSYASGVIVVGWAAYTIGTSGVSQRLRIRQTSVAGTTKADSGAVTATAANLAASSIIAYDVAPADSQVYKLTLTVGSASAGSTVSAVGLFAIAV